MGKQAKTRVGTVDEPPYTRYAFLNPYNLSLLAGAATTALATGHWWIIICAATIEALWLLFAPDSKVLQKVLWEKRWEQAKSDAVRERQDLKFWRLTPDDQVRVHALRDQRLRINQLAAENPSLAVDMMHDELAKLDALFEDFLDLAIVCGRCENQLRGFDLVELQRRWQSYQEQVKRFPKTDKRHEVAAKNLDVLVQRKNRMEAMQRSLQTARGHMDLMENSFRLFGDEIVTMADPTELATRLDDLRTGVQTIRESSDEVEAAYDELDEVPANEMRR